MGNPGLKTSHKIAYSSGNFSIYLMQQMVATFIVFFYVDHLGVRPGLISIAMVMHGVVNAAVHPLLGYVSDRTKTRWGRRVPYILFGMVPLSAAFTMMWIPVVPEAYLFWYFLGIIAVFDLAFVTVALNWTSLFPEMFAKLKDRSFVSSWRQIWGIIGRILGIASPPLLYTTIGWGNMAVIFGGLVLFFWSWSLYGAKESYEPPKEGPPFLKALKLTLMNKAFVAFAIGNFLVQLVFAILPGAAPFFTKYVLLVPESQTSFILGTIFVVALPFVYVWGKFINMWGREQSHSLLQQHCFFR
ncbi:putative xylose-proton symporter [Lentibacillus sp. JNUCC-1]|nr:MFS transporter [Lentibacillus sp. JNUCC-1]MUV36888.1 putative xylose-proton symporter [Lentibacillus sp. JNUCC-1]